MEPVGLMRQHLRVTEEGRLLGGRAQPIGLAHRVEQVVEVRDDGKPLLVVDTAARLNAQQRLEHRLHSPIRERLGEPPARSRNGAHNGAQQALLVRQRVEEPR